MRVGDDSVRYRRYDPRDAAAVWDLHEWALADAGTDPSDVPGTDDLRDVEAAYFEPGGAFLVGVDTATGTPADADGAGGAAARSAGAERTLPTTFDGPLVAMGGFVPTAAGHADERAVADDGTGTAELHRMRVAPPRQREGHGQRLLERLETQARALGFQRLLATTSRRQTAAVAFYPAHGYRQVDESTHGEYDLVHFEKSLSDGPTGDRSGASDAA